MSGKTNSTSYRQRVWDAEYAERQHLPSTTADQPSKALVTFFSEFNPEREAALDLGSGNGRNLIYLINQGFKQALGIEFSHAAVELARKKVEEAGLAKQITLKEQSLGEEIESSGEVFDLIIDMMVMHSLNETDRAVEINEIKRLLKPSGYFLIYTMAAESADTQASIAQSPGPEKNSYMFQVGDDWVTEKAFGKEELVELLSPLVLLKMLDDERPTVIAGVAYTLVHRYAVFQKPKRST